jgi:hypothetical protein
MPLSRPLLLTALLLAAALAGCSQPAPAPTDSARVEEVAAPAPETLLGQGTFGWAAAVGVPTTGVDTEVGASNAITIDVPDGAKRLDVNATWSCVPSPCTLHLYLEAPNAGPNSPLSPAAAHGMGDGQATAGLDNPVPGKWWAALHADSPDAQVAGTISYVVQLGASAPEPTENP